MSKLLSFNGYKQVQQSMFEIHTLQWLRNNGLYKYDQAHNSKSFEIIWVTSGAGFYWLDMYRASFQPNQLFFVSPGQVYKLQAFEDMEGYVISFTESFFELGDQQTDATSLHSLYKILAAQNGTTIKEELRQDMKDIAERMMKEYDKVQLLGTEILQRYFKIFMIYLTRQLEASFSAIRQTRNIELVQKFLSLLEKKYKTQKMVSEYAGELLVTANYLNEIVKKTTGMAAGHHIRKRIVLEAKRMGLYSDSCMKEIAYNLGFADSAHFSKFFKAVTGENFSDFKKEKTVFSIAV